MCVCVGYMRVREKEKVSVCGKNKMYPVLKSI